MAKSNAEEVDVSKTRENQKLYRKCVCISKDFVRKVEERYVNFFSIELNTGRERERK